MGKSLFIDYRVSSNEGRGLNIVDETFDEFINKVQRVYDKGLKNAFVSFTFVIDGKSFSITYSNCLNILCVKYYDFENPSIEKNYTSIDRLRNDIINEYVKLTKDNGEK